VQVVPLDLEDSSGHIAASDRVFARFGRIDYLVNNAGRSQRALIDKTDIRVDQVYLIPNMRTMYLHMNVQKQN
jgi:dehydrogenase/reductase SDR family protein 7